MMLQNFNINNTSHPIPRSKAYSHQYTKALSVISNPNEVPVITTISVCVYASVLISYLKSTYKTRAAESMDFRVTPTPTLASKIDSDSGRFY